MWWTAAALRRIADGDTVAARYADTVREKNANGLLDWLVDYGAGFGWRRTLDLDVLQGAANNGEVCIIVAQRRDLNRSGHVTAVVPEHRDFHAARNARGEVARPLESQAGTRNHRFVVKPRAWWTETRYAAFGFWRHA